MVVFYNRNEYGLVMRRNIILLVITSLGLFISSGLVFATSSDADKVNQSSMLDFISVRPSPNADVVKPLPQSPPNSGTTIIQDERPPQIQPVLSGGSLTFGEAKIVMGASRNFDFFTRKWSDCPALSGLKRENFLLSWEKARKKNGAVQGLPNEYLYNPKTIE